jgi:hypothetical protein
MAETNGNPDGGNEKKITLIKVEFTSDYRGSFGAFNAGDVREIEEAAFTALCKSGVCKKTGTAEKE